MKYRLLISILAAVIAGFVIWPQLALAQDPVPGTCTLAWNEWSAGVNMGSGDLTEGDWRTVNASLMSNNYYYLTFSTGMTLPTYIEARNNTGNNNGSCFVSANEAVGNNFSYGCSNSPFSVEIKVTGDGCVNPDPAIEQCTMFRANSEDFPWSEGSGNLTPGDWREVQAELMPNGYFYLVVTTEVTTTIHARNNTGDNSGGCYISPDDDTYNYFNYGCSELPFSVELQIEDNGCEFGQPCALVENADFITDTVWLLDGTAVITDGALTIGAGDIAAQNLTLEASTHYNAVVSTTSSISGSTPLNVVLGTDSETLTITTTGRYTATFTTPSNLAGPIVYGLENEGSDSLGVDFTCVSLATDDGSQGDCIAPSNGTFDSGDGWNWYRGASLFEPGKFASLPLIDNGMIGTADTYTMPTLAEGEHLLLGFTARGLDDGGVISGQVTNGTSTAEFNYSTYRAEYSYEASLDTLAEETDIQLSFVNPGDVITDVLSTADLVMDNVCIFVANRGPNLPAPTDPDGISPIDPGFQGFTSCSDLDGIWSAFGVNMAQYRTDYAVGTSVWDPLGWVPWLISAMFVTLASWSCFFFAAFLNLVDLITYFLNSVMNIGNWFARMWPLFVAWLDLWGDWLAASLANISNEIGNTLAAWSDWIGNALWATSETIAMTLVAAVEWIGTSLGNLSDWIAGFLADWSGWIAESLANLSDWLGATLAALWAWLSDFFTNFPGLRTIINWLIDGWNALLVVIGDVISQILDDLIGIWNDSLVPFLSAAWSFISSMPVAIAALLIDFIIAAWSLLYMMFVWLWENVISVAHLPITFYRAFDDGINADPYGLTSCAGENFWCTFLAGVQLINQLIAHSTFYPIVIVGIILSTLWILWDNIRELFFSPIEIR